MRWFVVCIKYGLTMEVSLAAKLASLWLKENEPALMKETPKLTVVIEDNNGVCPDC